MRPHYAKEAMDNAHSGDTSLDCPPLLFAVAQGFVRVMESVVTTVRIANTGNVARAAVLLLGIHRATLWRKLRRLA